MKVFISWSGELSRKCAELLRDWIKCTLQASEPWISSKDIDKGTLWFSEISDQLKDTKVGIVCLTQQNKDKPWILFESGALAKGLSANKVCTLLINLEPKDIDDPLKQFNHTRINKDDLKDLLYSINKELGDIALDEKVLDKAFNAYWSDFESDLKKAIKEHNINEKVEPARSSDDLLEEILYTTRAMDKRVRKLVASRKGRKATDSIAGSFLGEIHNQPPKEIIENDHGLMNYLTHLVKEGTHKTEIYDNIITEYRNKYHPEDIIEVIEREIRRYE